MGLRFRKSFKIAPGVRVNVGKKSTGVSFGGRGMRYSINTSGRRTASVGIPGTGISYVATSSGKSRNPKSNAYINRQALQKQQREIEKLQQLERAKHEVAMYENQVELLTSIHKEADEPIDWQQIKNIPAPFEEGSKGPIELAAIQKYETYKPSFIERIFKSLYEKKMKRLEREMDHAVEEDRKSMETWRDLHLVAEKILKSDIDTYFQVIQEMDPLGDITDFGGGFEFYTDDPSYINVDFDVHSESMVPKKEKKLTKTGKLSERELSKTRYYELQQDYICSCVLRIARDMFALLPVKYVYVHAYEEILSTVTGHVERVCILSIRIDRDTLSTLNLDNIDCSDSLANFEYNMNFKKTKGFYSVEKILV